MEIGDAKADSLGLGSKSSDAANAEHSERNQKEKVNWREDFADFPNEDDTEKPEDDVDESQ